MSHPRLLCFRRENGRFLNFFFLPMASVGGLAGAGAAVRHRRRAAGDGRRRPNARRLPQLRVRRAV